LSHKQGLAAAASLIGVIVSHVIVLFDFIEEVHEKGEPLERALPDAGIERIRPVMITVGATILALFPLALEGGPLWKPLCYAQTGALPVATFITLLLLRSFTRSQMDQMGNHTETKGGPGVRANNNVTTMCK
jgi:multidrug efflux pump subunit AcrB